MLTARNPLPLAARVGLCLSLIATIGACDGDDAAGSKDAAAEKATADKDSKTEAADNADKADASADKAQAPVDDGAEAPTSKVNLNTGTKEEFMKIPDVGARMAHEFDEYRPWVSIQQFRKEIGKYVDAEQVAKFENFVYVPIDVNACDAETLQQLATVDAAAAEALIAGRPYASNADFVAKLDESVRADAETMLAPAG